ncbi:MAG: hypothetical protein E6901_07745 [Cutibacterium granulosum]|nr:hypothetical protein [Cutibacterium granulosum]
MTSPLAGSSLWRPVTIFVGTGQILGGFALPIRRIVCPRRFLDGRSVGWSRFLIDDRWQIH